MFKVLEPANLGRMELRNRFMRSATWDGTADESGQVTDQSVRLYSDLAAGGVGLIVTAYAFVSDSGQAAHGQYGVHRDEMIPGLRRLVGAAHDGGAKIAAQIVHAGSRSGYRAKSGHVNLAPSQSEDTNPHRAMTEAEIEGAIEDFAAAALRVKEAGFDGVQLHGAHGFLMSQFFSPLTNTRQDAWGGSAENRRRFHVETVRRIRQAVGADFPISIKFGVADDIEDGATFEEGIAAIQAMVEAGLDMVEVSFGLGRPEGAAIREKNGILAENAFLRERAARVKRATTIPVATVYGIRTIETAEDIIAFGDGDLISMSRPLIRESGLINRWLSGELKSATCISCGKCMAIVARGEPLECGEDRRIREEGQRAAQA